MCAAVSYPDGDALNVAAASPAARSPRLPLVSDLFLVRQARGPTWDPARGRREQAGWREHAEFIDRLTDQGRVLLAGPLEDADGEYVCLVLAASDHEDARELLAADPWADGVLRTDSIERWIVWVGAERLGSPTG